MRATGLRLTFLGLLAAVGPASAQNRPLDAPEAATPTLATPAAQGRFGVAAKPPVRAKRFMVVAANPLAADAGAKILAAGGTAADALVAVQTVLGLVEPQSSGLGGGTFLVWYDAATKRVTTLDGRETAPAAATPSLFLDAAGKPLDFMAAVIGGRSVGVPGTPRLLGEAHRRWGRTPWADLLRPAIDLAESGFAVSPRLASLVADDAERLKTSAPTKAYFLDAAGAPLPAGHLLKNPAYAATLRALASGGADAFYAGGIADSIVATVRSAAGNPGAMTADDLKDYQVKERPPVCVDYRAWQVCGMGPPSTGALTVGQILKLIEPFDLARMAPMDATTSALLADATRLAFADRERYMADADFVDVPAQALLDPAYLGARSKLLDEGARLVTATAGDLTKKGGALFGDGQALEIPSTSHFVIVDAAGNVASMTSSIEAGFGSRLMTGGFLLNNELTDFSFLPEAEGRPVANRVEGGKRPRSSMAPTIVLKDGKPVLAIGSPGGSRIIPYVASALVAVLDWGATVQEAVSMPHFVNRTGLFEVEKGTAATAVGPALQALGYEVKATEQASGLHAVAITPAGLEGGVDPRREGKAAGE